MIDKVTCFFDATSNFQKVYPTIITNSADNVVARCESTCVVRQCRHILVYVKQLNMSLNFFPHTPEPLSGPRQSP